MADQNIKFEIEVDSKGFPKIINSMHGYLGDSVNDLYHARLTKWQRFWMRFWRNIKYRKHRKIVRRVVAKRKDDILGILDFRYRDIQPPADRMYRCQVVRKEE